MDSNEHPDIPNPSQYPDASFNVSPSTPGAPLYASTSAGYNFQTTSASSANPRYPFHPLSATPAGNTFLSPNAAYTSRPRNPTLHAINNISSIDTSFSPPTNIDHTQSSSPSNAFTPLTSKNTTHPRRSTRAGLRLTSSPSPGSSTLSGGVTKSRPSSVTGGKLLREKRTLIPITDSMTPAEKAAAKQENYRLRNGDSAAKSRIRKTMAVVEGALAARGYAADVEMLLELLRESERVMGSCGIHSTWEGVKMGVMERYGLEFHEGRDIKEVLFRRDEGVLGLLADPEEARYVRFLLFFFAPSVFLPLQSQEEEEESPPDTCKHCPKMEDS
ncbi:hypothetical protein B0T14DRAFT_222997 [Immersiella caudata]|uniref:Uncharacterized protein n=1 Tax=Immersiella caudata TaxID=314043 RepID=A0AA40BZZ4_9PEZI|nr:hypothetical protein B0T14DRAFT_222997 [Immersiella caudata]